MTGVTGLGPLEVALLDALDLLGGVQDADRVSCGDVLNAVDRLHGIGARYAWPALVDIGVPWRLHLPLVELHGNAGSLGGDPPADAVYVESRLSAVGALALAAERGELGPVPLGLIEGSLYRDGQVPPFSPARVVGALLAGESDVGPPVMPTGGTVACDLDGLLAGHAVLLTLGCTLRVQDGTVVVTEVPLGVTTDRIIESIASRRSTYDDGGEGRGFHVVHRPDSPVADIRDETSARDGLRIVVHLRPGTDPVLAMDWLRDVWPVTFGVRCRLPAPMAHRLSSWDRGDGSGLRALSDLLRDLPIP
jgi:hypothetical protein